MIIIQKDFSDLSEILKHLSHSKNFYLPWFNIADSLGFAGVIGYGGKNIGDNLLLENNTEGFSLQAKAFGSSSRSQVKITFNNFKLFVLPDSFSTSLTTTKNLQSEILITSKFSNNTNSDANILKRLTFMTSTKTTFSYFNKFAAGLGFKANVDFNLAGYTEQNSIAYTFSYEYTMGNQKEQIDLTKIIDEISFSLPPKHSTLLKLVSYRTLNKVPFTALALISYNVNLYGSLSLSTNALKDKKQLVPYSKVSRFAPFEFTFGNEDISAEDDIKQQITNATNPETSTPWNWTIAASKDSFNAATPIIFHGFATEFKGEFQKTNSKNMVIEIGPYEAL